MSNREWSLTIKNGKVYPYAVIGKDIETVPVIEKKAYDELLNENTEMENILAICQKKLEELIAITEKQKSQIYQLEKAKNLHPGESITFDEFLRRGMKPSIRR